MYKLNVVYLFNRILFGSKNEFHRMQSPLRSGIQDWLQSVEVNCCLCELQRHPCELETLIFDLYRMHSEGLPRHSLEFLSQWVWKDQEFACLIYLQVRMRSYDFNDNLCLYDIHSEGDLKGENIKWKDTLNIHLPGRK